MRDFYPTYGTIHLRCQMVPTHYEAPGGVLVSNRTRRGHLKSSTAQ